MSNSSLVPIAPLTDEVFPFNQQHFLDILKYQQRDLQILSSNEVKEMSKVIDQSKIALRESKGISKSEKVAADLVDPGEVVSDHIRHSNNVKKEMDDAIKDADNVISEFSYAIGNGCQDLYGNIHFKGAQILTDLEGRLQKVSDALWKMKKVLTKSEENVEVGKDKYLGIKFKDNLKNSLGDIGGQLPKVIKSIDDVKAAFDAIHSNISKAKEKINSGVTRVDQIFVEHNSEDVKNAWLAFEEKRKAMEYIPYQRRTD